MDIFRKKAVRNAMPKVYPNLALRGNRAVQYSLNKTTSLSTDGRELSVPSLPYVSKLEERKATNLVMMANKLYRLSKYRDIRDEELLELAKILAASANTVVMYRKLMFPSHMNATTYNVNRRRYRYDYDSKFREYEKAIDEKITDVVEQHDLYIEDEFSPTEKDLVKLKDYISEDEYNFLHYRTMSNNVYPEINTSEINNVVSKSIDMLYQGYKAVDVLRYFVKRLGIAKITLYEDQLKDTVKNSVMRNTMLGHFSDDVINQEVQYLVSFIHRMNTILGYAQWKHEHNKYKLFRENWSYNHHKKKWDKAIRTILRPKGLVKAIYKTLEGNSSAGKDMKLKYSYENLPSTLAMQLQEALEGGIKLPDNLSEELKNEIMQDANNNAERFEYRNHYESNGVHGKAIIKPFKPNDKVITAIRELRKRNSDIGVVPKNMHRMTTDRKVFTSRKTVAGGSMMIDCSGSMSWSNDDVRDIIETLPASTIAGYVGYNFNIDGYDGEIRIIAKNGQIDTRAIDNLLRYGNNSVDMEGLKWLAQQDEPRIWVSDQQVIGVRPDGSGRVTELSNDKKLEILKFMQKNNIIPIESYKTVKKVAKELATSVKRNR